MLGEGEPIGTRRPASGERPAPSSLAPRPCFGKLGRLSGLSGRGRLLAPAVVQRPALRGGGRWVPPTHRALASGRCGHGIMVSAANLGLCRKDCRH